MAPVSRDSTPGRVFNDLRNKARREGRSTDELLVLYVLERWLYRAAVSPDAERFVLKGGLLLATLGARRPTRDGDLLAYLQQDEDDVVDRIGQIAAISIDDGVTYQVDQARQQPIREDGHYAGVRVTMPASIGRARVKLALDVNFGDPVTPGAVKVGYPTLLPGDPFQVLAYPVETVIAEKVVTAVTRGETNTRDRDWADLWRLTGTHAVTETVMTEALRRTAGYRAVELSPMRARLGTLIDRRAVAYRTWRRRQGVDATAYPPAFSDLVRDVLGFADPLLNNDVPGQRWEPRDRMWR